VLTCIYGFVILYSAAGGQIKPWAYKQITMMLICIPLVFLIAIINIRNIYKISYIAYFLSIFLLIIVHFFGKTAMGATRWIDLGLFRLQPSELTKISIVLMLARMLHNIKGAQIKNYIQFIPIVATLIPCMLVIIQPDLGTGIVTLIVASIMFFAAGVPIRYFVILGSSVVVAMPLLWQFMHNYQKNRVLIFLDPEREPLGAGYNIIQSKIAIGSGGMFGKGFLEGTQSHLNFLPEYQTDFIFAFLTEELGFVGGCVLLLLYFSIMLFSLVISINARSKFAKLLSVGVTAIFFTHVFINIAMVMGLLPVVGVPLPLISYGGTMMVSMLIGFGLIMNVAVHQYTIISIDN
jgi:rod shape determining protein RodA